MFNYCIYSGNKYVITMYITQEKYAYLEDLCHVAPIEMDFQLYDLYQFGIMTVHYIYIYIEDLYHIRNDENGFYS